MSTPRPAATARGRVAATAVVLAAALALAGCGIPTGAAKPIARSDVPFHLLDPGTTPTTSAAPPAVGVAETIYLVAPDQQHLVAVQRVVAVPASLSDVVGALLAGPTSTEQAGGIGTFLAASHIQFSTSVAGGVATVSFASNPVQVVGPDQTIAIAQLVWSVTEQPGITQVLVHIGGQPVEVPVAGGAQVAGPVNRFDYLPQAPT